MSNEERKRVPDLWGIACKELAGDKIVETKATLTVVRGRVKCVLIY